MNKVMNEWTFGGVRLDSFGPVTELDAYLDMPPKRGDNVLIPMQHGRVWVPKYFDQRIISFGIEVTGRDISDLEQKFDRVKALFGSTAQQILKNNFCDGPRSALAEVLNQLGPTRDPDPLVAKIVVDFQLADPFFRSSILKTETFDIPNSLYTLDNPGTAPERHAIITFADVLDHPIFGNTANGDLLEYNAAMGAGDVVIIDCEHYTAVDGGGNNVVGNIIHSGDTSFMTFNPGVNVLTLSDAGGADTGTGTVQIDYYPPYL
jgi:hypothetical protein